jgi:hypothetical protein
MRCPNCGGDCADGKFCNRCGAAISLSGADAVQPPRRKRGCAYYLGIVLLLGLLAFIAVPLAIIIPLARREAHKQEAADAAARQKAHQKQLYFESTPEGKKAKAAEQKAKNEAEVQTLARVMFAQKIEKTLLNGGHDVKCSAGSDTILIVTGPAVNQVFASQFMRVPGAVKNMRKAGFTEVRFWNGNSFTDVFAKTYDLTP